MKGMIMGVVGLWWNRGGGRYIIVVIFLKILIWNILKI